MSRDVRKDMKMRPQDHPPGCGGKPETCYVDCVRRHVCWREADQHALEAWQWFRRVEAEDRAAETMKAWRCPRCGTRWVGVDVCLRCQADEAARNGASCRQ